MLGFLDPSENSYTRLRRNRIPKRKVHQDAVNITTFLMIVYCDILAVCEEV